MGARYWSGKKPAGAPEGIDPIEALEITSGHLKSVALADLPPLTSGLVGFMGYDAVRRMERLPSIAKDDLQIPELSFMLISDLAIFDHATSVVTLIANAINWDGSNERVDQAFDDAIARLDQMEERPAFAHLCGAEAQWRIVYRRTGRSRLRSRNETRRNIVQRFSTSKRRFWLARLFKSCSRNDFRPR